MSTPPARKQARLAVMEYLRANADRPITIQEVADNTTQVYSSVAGALRTLAIKQPDRVTRVGGGLYRWHSSPVDVPPKAPASRDMLLTFIKDSSVGNGVMLMRDDDTGELYVVKPFNLEF